MTYTYTGEADLDREPGRAFVDPVQVAALVHKGLTAEQAAKETGLALYTVRKAAREMGLRFRDPRSPTLQQEREIVAMRKRMSLSEVARATGYSRSAILKMERRATK